MQGFCSSDEAFGRMPDKPRNRNLPGLSPAETRRRFQKSGIPLSRNVESSLRIRFQKSELTTYLYGQTTCRRARSHN